MQDILPIKKEGFWRIIQSIKQDGHYDKYNPFELLNFLYNNNDNINPYEYIRDVVRLYSEKGVNFDDFLKKNMFNYKNVQVLSELLINTPFEE